MLVLLDLDGTLTDQYEGITRSVSYALERLALAPLPEAQLRSFIGPPLQDQFASLGLDDDGVAQAVTFYRERFAEHGLYENRVYDGIEDALAALSGSSHRLAVATSKPTHFAERILSHFGLAQHVELVVGATLDGERRHKADIIEFALSSLTADCEDAVMVGDRAQDVTGARACSVRSVGVKWGYAEPGELEDAGVDLLVESPQELVSALISA